VIHSRLSLSLSRILGWKDPLGREEGGVNEESIHDAASNVFLFVVVIVIVNARRLCDRITREGVRLEGEAPSTWYIESLPSQVRTG